MRWPYAAARKVPRRCFELQDPPRYEALWAPCLSLLYTFVWLEEPRPGQSLFSVEEDYGSLNERRLEIGRLDPLHRLGLL